MSGSGYFNIVNSEIGTFSITGDAIPSDVAVYVNGSLSVMANAQFIDNGYGVSVSGLLDIRLQIDPAGIARIIPN